METREKSEEQVNAAPDLTLNENVQQAPAEVNNEEVAADAPAEAKADAPAEAAAEVPVEAAAEAPAEPAEKADGEVAEVETSVSENNESVEEVPAAVASMTVENVIAALEVASAKPADEISRDEVSKLKQQFYTLRKERDHELLEAFVADGNPAEAFVAPEEDADDVKFKELLNAIKEKKAARVAEIEAEQQRNHEAKDALIAELKAMSEDTDNVNRSFPRFREIQAEFKAIGEVAPQLVSDQWKRYQDAVEHFYDQLKINKDLRDYDFKKNLAIKQQLIEEAEKLVGDDDVVGSFSKLQALHRQWRETGPVAKEIREEIWNRFKDASTEINKKYQTYFEQRKQAERDNEVAKTAICERVEALDFENAKSFNAWNDLTKEILQAQEDWKKLGFASKKVNNTLFARFRATCDKFFALKAEYYKTVKGDLAANLEKKLALCEQAEALKDSTDWRATADKLVELQKQWKQIGTVSKKYSDAVWTRFQQACDYFFEQKKKDLNETRHTEQANLKAKRALTASLKEIAPDTPKEQILAAIKDAQAKWSEIGHVPFREKDKVYEEFRATINELYKTHDLRESRANFARFEDSIAEISDSNKLSRERERLARVLEQKRADLVNYQNNLGFFNFKSTSGSSMLRDIERKTQRIKDDIADLEKKIAVIDERL